MCSKSFKSKLLQKSHEGIHLKNSKWECPECDKKYSKKSKLIEHVNRHKGTPQFKCKECGKDFYRNDRLKTHILSHLNERPFQCTVCSLAFRRKYELNKHVKTHDIEQSEKMKKFICERCGKRTYSAADLKRHMLKYTNERNFDCRFCSKKFKDKYTLKCHEVCKHTIDLTK